jgi:hypothetical protein
MSPFFPVFYDTRGVRYGSMCMPRVQYVVCVSGIAVVVSDGVNVFFIMILNVLPVCPACFSGQSMLFICKCSFCYISLFVYGALIYFLLCFV